MAGLAHQEPCAGGQHVFQHDTLRMVWYCLRCPVQRTDQTLPQKRDAR